VARKQNGPDQNKHYLGMQNFCDILVLQREKVLNWGLNEKSKKFNGKLTISQKRSMRNMAELKGP